MKYMISLNPVPQWGRYDLVKDIRKKIEMDKLDAQLSGDNADTGTHGDLPAEIIVQGTTVALTLLIVFINDWLAKRRIQVEYKDDKVTISGCDPKRIIEIKKMIEQDTHEQ